MLSLLQERMKAEHGTKSGHMMKAMNAWSCLYLGVGLLMTGEIWTFLAFVGRHPAIVWQLASVSVASALGQYFIFMCVSEFGPLPCSLVTTTRKFFTVLGSVIIFGNSLLNRQWAGAVLVFTGGLSVKSRIGVSLTNSVLLVASPTTMSLFVTISTLLPGLILDGIYGKSKPKEPKATSD